MIFKSSFVHRGRGFTQSGQWHDPDKQHTIRLETMSPYYPKLEAITLIADVGGRGSEPIHVVLHQDDFREVFEQMLQVDREKTINSFAAAILAKR